MPTHPEMSAPILGRYLRRIRLTRSASALRALAAEIERRFPDDEATPRLLGLIAVKAARLASVPAPRHISGAVTTIILSA